MFKKITSKLNFSRKYAFPIFILIALGILTIVKISGSSIGPYYDYYFNGESSSNLIAGDLRGVRTDEWLVTTQLTMAQEAAGFPVVNENIGQGKNMSLISDVPYIEWSAAFKPQNFSFLVMPLENAFAFKWWFLVATLLVSSYFLALRFLPKKYLIASLIAVIFSFSPFIFWWYQSITIMPIVWIIVALVFAIRILDNRSLAVFQRFSAAKLLTQLTLAAGLTYSVVAFGLVLYPAFQIPLAIVVLLFLVGYFLSLRQNTEKPHRKSLYKSLIPIVAAGFAAIAIVGAFVFTRVDAIQDITGTVYPGARSIDSGEVAAKHIIALLAFDQYRLLDDSIQTSALDAVQSNQSEMSSFLVLSFLYIIPLSLFGAWRWRKQKKIDWITVGILLGNAILFCHLLFPLFTPLSKIFFLQAVPPIRLLIGMGLLGTLSLIYLISVLRKYKKDLRPYIKPVTIAYTAVLIVFYLVGIIYLHHKFPEYIGDIRIAILIATLYIVGVVGTMLSKPIFGLSILATMTVLFTATIQPMYVGLGPIYKNDVVNTIQKVSDDTSVWGVSGDMLLENMPTISDRKNVSGTQFSPDNEYWNQIQNNDTDIIYNRYAHVLLNDDQEDQLHLVQADYFTAKISCTNLVGKTVTHILSNKPIKSTCYELIKTLDLPTRSIYFYKMH